MIDKRTWQEFTDTKLLWWVNRSLHLFGWAIVVAVEDDGTVTDAYPARVKFRGFSEETEAEGFITLTEYLKGRMDTLAEEAKS